jgi:hypothetical protein
LAIWLEREKEQHHGQKPTQGKQGNPQAKEGGTTKNQCLEPILEGRAHAPQGLIGRLLMVPSSALCRAQETLHRHRAADTRLENVRIVETTAAMAWGREAEAAERRERRQKKATGIVADAIDDIANADGIELMLSENPDRAMATL